MGKCVQEMLGLYKDEFETVQNDSANFTCLKQKQLLFLS